MNGLWYIKTSTGIEWSRKQNNILIVPGGLFYGADEKEYLYRQDKGKGYAPDSAGRGY